MGREEGYVTYQDLLVVTMCGVTRRGEGPKTHQLGDRDQYGPTMDLQLHTGQTILLPTIGQHVAKTRW